LPCTRPFTEENIPWLTATLTGGLYTTITGLALAEGAESCTPTNKTGRDLMTWERKTTRKIYTPPYENDYWTIKTEQEIL
jgi:hypothetical protein